MLLYLEGIVTTELNAEGQKGRVAYENCGECFFFEFTRDDLVDTAVETLHQGQPVQFVITQDTAGNLQAGQVRLLPAAAVHQNAAALGAPHLAPQQIPQPQQFIATPMVGTMYPGSVVVPMSALHPAHMTTLAHPHQVPVAVAGYSPHGAQVRFSLKLQL